MGVHVLILNCPQCLRNFIQQVTANPSSCVSDVATGKHNQAAAENLQNALLRIGHLETNGYAMSACTPPTLRGSIR